MFLFRFLLIFQQLRQSEPLVIAADTAATARTGGSAMADRRYSKALKEVAGRLC
jgi:hypothetical protein